VHALPRLEMEYSGVAVGLNSAHNQPLLASGFAVSLYKGETERRQGGSCCELGVAAGDQRTGTIER
jgi:hypothetical protein